MRPNAPVLLHIFMALLSSHIFSSTCQHLEKISNHPNNGFNDVEPRDWDGDNEYVTAYGTSLSAEGFSTPEGCARTCQDGEAPRRCYYKFTMEHYKTMTRACESCTPNNRNQPSNTPQCQCIQADGVERDILTINRMLPGPMIDVCKNDVIIVDVTNDIEGMELTIHWHGMWQKGSQYYDGAPGMTQCPIISGTTFRYQFIAGNSGTHFYHPHVVTASLDGQYGPLIVRDPLSSNPHSMHYDEDRPEHVIMISDIFYRLPSKRFPGCKYNQNRCRSPESLLINGKGRWKDSATNITTTWQPQSFTVEAGKRYRFRLINSMGSVFPTQLSIEGHSLEVIAQDGESVQPTLVNTINTVSGERVDFVLNANKSSGTSWIQVRGARDCNRHILYELAVLKYLDGPELPDTPEPDYQKGLDLGIVYNPPDDICDVDRTSAVCANQLKAADRISMEQLNEPADYTLTLPFRMFSYDSTNNMRKLFEPGTYRKFMVDEYGRYIWGEIDNISHTFSSGPALSQPGDAANTCNRNHLPKNCSKPCVCPHTYHFEINATVDVLLYDANPEPTAYHQFHLHGHLARLLLIGRFADSKNITEQDISEIRQKHQKMLESGSYEQPPGKDAIVVCPGCWVIFRFLTDNPGPWLFDCHSEFQSTIGLNVVFHVGEQSDLPPVPPGFPTCGNFKPDSRIN